MIDRLMERKNDRDKVTTLPAIQAQIKALTRWGTDPVTLDLHEIRQPVLYIFYNFGLILKAKKSGKKRTNNMQSMRPRHFRHTFDTFYL